MPPDFLGAPGTPLRRFEESMLFDYGRWRDGEGFDLAALREMSPGERGLIEPKLKGSTGRLHAEALAELKRLAPPVSPPRTVALVNSLGTRNCDDGLLTALDEVVEYHPAEVVAALWRGVRYRRGSEAIAFAGILLFLHRKIPAPSYQPPHPFLLGFRAPETSVRAQALRDLCQEVGVSFLSTSLS